VFASMWADQVSSSDAASSHKKDLVTGYSVHQDDEPASNNDVPDVVVPEAAAAPEVPAAVASESLTDSPQVMDVDVPAGESADEPEVAAQPENEAAPVAFPTSDETPVAFPSSSDGPEEEVTFPSSEVAAPEPAVEFPASDGATPPVAASDGTAPIAFPGAKDTASERAPSVAERSQQSPPAVTFQNLATPPRSGTPDLEQDGKRRRTLSTQGIQRLARRISLSGRRQGSSGSILADVVAGLKRENTTSSKDKDKDDASRRGESSSITREISRDSPVPSVQSEVVKSKSKKEKKDRRKSGL